MKEVLVTKEGLDELIKEHDTLVSVTRQEVSEKIKIAREFGDLSENAEYDAAKEEQGFVEARILELEEKIHHAVIIDSSTCRNKVSIGSKVKLLDLEYDEEVEYRIVGSTEANLDENKISNESAVGAALIGKKKNDLVQVHTPAGTVIEYRIIGIK